MRRVMREKLQWDKESRRRRQEKVERTGGGKSASWRGRQ